MYCFVYMFTGLTELFYSDFAQEGILRRWHIVCPAQLGADMYKKQMAIV